MTLLDTIKSILGLGGDRGSDADREAWFDESESPEPATASEAAVKGVEGTAGDDEPDAAASGSDATASTDSMVDADGDDAAETAEAAGPSNETDGLEDHSEVESSSTADGETGTDSTDDAATAGGDATASTGSMTDETDDSIAAAENAEAAGPVDGEPADDAAENDVDVLKGIGPSYADRLDEAGVETVADLAGSDPTDLADETGIAESRVDRWTDRAEARRQ